MGMPGAPWKLSPGTAMLWESPWEGPFYLGGFCVCCGFQSKGRDVVTQASQITFLKSAKGKHLTAVAQQVKDGKRICFYEVKVTDELGTEVAFVTVNGYVVHDNGRGEDFKKDQKPPSCTGKVSCARRGLWYGGRRKNRRLREQPEGGQGFSGSLQGFCPLPRERAAEAAAVKAQFRHSSLDGNGIYLGKQGFHQGR